MLIDNLNYFSSKLYSSIEYLWCFKIGMHIWFKICNTLKYQIIFINRNNRLHTKCVDQKMRAATKADWYV